MKTLEHIARALGGEVCGNQVRAPGPGHSPKDRSLNVKLDANAPGGFVLHSFSPTDDPIVCKDYVREKLGLPPWNGDANGPVPRHKAIVAIYDYSDEKGELLYQVVRFEPKDFRQRRPNGKGDWIWSLGETRRVPYRLLEIEEAVSLGQTIFIAEGEKAADALVDIGVRATCAPGGAGKWRDEYSPHLADADVVILPDNDGPGEQHCKSVGKALTGVAERVRVLRLPELPIKGDAYDWVQAGGTAKQLWQLVEQCSVEWSAKSDSSGPALICRCASEIELEPVEWLWCDRLARGKHTCIAGEPGTGKSQLSIAIAAAISTGGKWPFGEARAPQGSVLMLSAEDGAADTIVPRLHAVGADLGRVQIVSAVRSEDGRGRRSFNLQADIALLEKEIARIGDVALVVIDPISSYLGKTDSHKNADVRGVLEPLGEMAERTRVAVLSITHFSKTGGGTGAKALHKFIGSIAFVGAPRIAFVVLEDPEDQDRRLFLHAKNNLAAPPQGLAFRLEQTIVGDAEKRMVASRVKWEASAVTISADEVLAATGGSSEYRTTKTEAIAFLRTELAQGPKPAAEVLKATTAAGHTQKAIRTAREALGIKPHKASMKEGWVWALPKTPTHTREDAHEDNWAPSGTFENSRIRPGTSEETGRWPEDVPSSKWAPSASEENAAFPGDAVDRSYPDLPECLDRRRSR